MTARPPRRPAVRKSDLQAAYAAGLALGLRPHSTRFYGDGGFTIEWGEKPVAANDDGVEAEIAAFEEALREG